MTDLADFLRARIAEEEAAANVDTGAVTPADAWTPARVLAEREAKRRIIAGHAPWHVCPNISDRGGQDYEGNEIDLEPCPTLRLLALPYSDHQDYREEWRP